MNLISTTQLRTDTKHLLQMLAKGETVHLIHRSKSVAQLIPQQTTTDKIFDSKDFLNTLSKLPKHTNLSDKQRQDRYRSLLKKNYG
jgi:antitoxin (DNA-binding transcriptional repressor) of toxin-antitoxin stability system